MFKEASTAAAAFGFEPGPMTPALHIQWKTKSLVLRIREQRSAPVTSAAPIP